MDGTTKICKGILHPDGIELHIEKFSKRSHRPSRHTICKDCINAKQKITRTNYDSKYSKTNKYKIAQKKYLDSKKGKEIKNKLAREYNKRHKNIRHVKRINNIYLLSDSYIKETLKHMGIYNIRLESIKIKREQLLLFRETKNYYHGQN